MAIKKEAKQKHAQSMQETEITKMLNKFCEMYCLQKGIDLDDVELCHYTESNGKRSVMYFRLKKPEVKKYGPETKQN